MGNGNAALYIFGSMIENDGRAQAEVKRSRGSVRLERFWSAADAQAHKKERANAKK